MPSKLGGERLFEQGRALEAFVLGGHSTVEDFCHEELC